MKALRSILAMIIALAITSVANAQELKVVSFEKLLTDVTARSTAVKDGNGDVCALIKVSLPVEGCEFAGNIVGQPEFHVSEYWVYMTPSSKKLIVRCPGCESLNADFGMAVESAVTYHLKLSGYSTATGSSKNQPVTFKITPADAVLTIDQNEYSTQSGVAQVMLSPGEHTYAVFAPGYNVQGSKFMVYENNNNKIIVELEAKTQTAGNLEVLPVVEETKVFDVVEQMPRFPGDNGNGAVLNGWLSKNLIYPPIAEKNGIKGRVICQFVIERDGSITDLEIVRSVDPSLDQEAVRVIKAMPKWIPGKQNGSSVRVKFTLPIIFTLHN